MVEPTFHQNYDVNLSARKPYFKGTDVSLSEKTGRAVVKPELKPFFETPYFQRQKLKAKIFEEAFRAFSGNYIPATNPKSHQRAVFYKVQTQGRMRGLTIKKRQWKNFIKLMKGGHGRPMNIEEKHAYAHKLTRCGYGLTTVVTALDACKTVWT